MARRKTVKAAVKDIRRDHPEATVEVLRDCGWDHTIDGTPLTEAEWAEYRVNCVRWFGDFAVIHAS